MRLLPMISAAAAHPPPQVFDRLTRLFRALGDCDGGNTATSLDGHLSYRTVRIWETRSTKAIATIPTKGENINIAWAPDGKTIAVGNKEDLVTFIDAKSHKIVREEQFKFEVNEISWSRPSDLLFLTNGQVRKS